MSYGYESSEPNLTLDLRLADFTTLQRIAKRLGFTQTRGATVGQGSASAFVTAIAHAAVTDMKGTAAKLNFALMG